MKTETIHLKEPFSFLGENGADPTVELYLPYNMAEMHRENDRRPCMVVCPGGGYHMCSERESEPIALTYLAEGFNVFVLTYTTASKAPCQFPTQLREVAALMELIHQNAEVWHCDTERIAIIGFSAGAHLAAHYSTRYDCQEVRAVFPESKRVTLTLLSYPVISADPAVSHQGSFVNLIGHAPENEEERVAFSCDCWVSGNTPPAFIWHTAEDNCVSVQNSLRYASALAAHHVPFELHIYPFGSHGLSTCDALSCDPLNERTMHAHAWLEASKKWLKLML